MTAFAKKVSKAVKRPENCIVIGNAFDHLAELSETFNTVFILSSGIQEFRGKNVVYRENFEDVSVLPPINAVFFNRETLEQLKFVDKVIEKNKSAIFIEGSDHIKEDYHIYMKKKKYKLVEIHKDHQRWERTK